MVLPMFVGLCVCFLQGLSIGIEALFMVLPMFVGALGLFLARTLYWYRGIVYGTPNVCRAIVSVSCKDSLLVYMHCLFLLSMFVGVCVCFLTRTLYWYICIVYKCSQCL